MEGDTHFTGLIIASTGVSLTGGGEISLSADGYIGGATPSAPLTNVDNTIVGGGFIKTVALTNDAGGLIDDDAGRMVINTHNTISNAGTIESTGTGILLIRDTSISGTGSVIDGNRMQLDSAAIYAGLISVASGAVLQSSLDVAFVTGSVTNAGTIIGAAGGGLIVDGAVANSGLVEAVNGDLTITGAVSGTGSARLFGSGNLEVDGALSENVSFAATSTGRLVLVDTAGFTGSISGFSTKGKNQIDLRDITFDGSDTAKFSGTSAGGTLSILNSSKVVIATLSLTGPYRSSTFTLSTDGSGGTLISDPPKASTLTSAIASFGARRAATLDRSQIRMASAATLLARPCA